MQFSRYDRLRLEIFIYCKPKFTYMKSLIPKLIALCLIVAAGYRAEAQLYTFTDDALGTPTFTAPNLTGTNLERFKCDSTVLCGTGFMSDKFSKNDSFTVNRSSINVTLTPDFGYSLNATSMSVEVRRNVLGPDRARLAYSNDGGATWVTNGSDIVFEFGHCDEMTTLSWDFDDFITENPVVFRVIMFSSNGTSGKLQVKNYNIGGGTFANDNDGDGYGFDVDCDDTNPDINPGATEICNLQDDNCDGNIDEGVMTTYYADADGDSYGDPASTILGCFPPDGYVENSADCNDADAAINPGASEICNGVDDNCDGNIDEGIDLSIAISPNGVIELCKPEEITLTATAGYDSYQWYKNGSPLAGETGDSYTTNKPGYYQVEGFIDACNTGLSEVQAVAVYESPSPNIFTPDGLDICVDGPVLIKVSYDASSTYQWYLDGGLLTDSTDYKIFTGTIGDYHCVITLGTCTTTTEDVTVINSCRLAELADQITIYPNPAKSEFTVSLSGAQISNSEAIIQVSDLTGRIIYSNTAVIANGEMHTSVSLTGSTPAGMYIVTISAENQNWNQRMTLVK